MRCDVCKQLSAAAFIALFSTAISFTPLPAQEEANYDEAKIRQYTLPDPLIRADGTKVASREDWFKKRRPEILKLFESEVYGKVPGRLKETTFETVSVDENALGGKAIRKEIIVRFNGKKDGPSMTVLLYLPKEALKKPVPVFAGLNFNGNHTLTDEPGISVTKSWVRDNKEKGIVNNRAGEKSRGVEKEQWQVEAILGRGYALATAYYGDIDPDFDDNFQNGVHPLFYRQGQTKPAADEWGSIGAWAWGLSRIVDYLETDSAIDAKKLTVLGHSRLGKTALWAGAIDQRFALVISNNSGCGGAALERRNFGETVARINRSFPHWFCDNYNKYSGKEAELPVDTHMLLALIAPRPVYVASASEDLWADPKGEFLAAYHASPVYRLLGLEGLSSPEMPANDRPLMTTVGYHNRTGKHDVTRFDWRAYLAFADKHFGCGK